MGWDAFSAPLNTNWGLDHPDQGDRAWDDTVAALRARGLTVDGCLMHGALDMTICGRMLERATGRSVYGPDWPPGMVKQLAADANWDFETSPATLWAKESARAFLTRCAELGRGIRFSW